MIWAVGLRGAVAYGLALNLPQIEGESDEGIPAIESATLVIVVLSTLILGGATGPLLRYFDLQARICFLFWLAAWTGPCPQELDWPPEVTIAMHQQCCYISQPAHVVGRWTTGCCELQHMVMAAGAKFLVPMRWRMLNQNSLCLCREWTMMRWRPWGTRRSMRACHPRTPCRCVLRRPPVPLPWPVALSESCWRGRMQG